MNNTTNIDSILSCLDKVRSSGRDKWIACCPSHEDSEPSLGIKIGGDGRILLHCFAQCHIDEITAALGLSIKDLFPDSGNYARSTVVPIDPYRQILEEKKHKQQAALAVRHLTEVFNSSWPLGHPDSAVVLAYLRSRLGGHSLDPLPGDIRCHGFLPYYDSELKRRTGHYPAMIGVIRNVSGEKISLHRTYLTKNGRKASVNSPKKLMTPPWPRTVTGGAIQLYKPSETLIVAEGIETALALSVSLDEPAWAAISAHFMATMKIPDGVKAVIIGADNDKSGTGQRAAEALKSRLLNEGRKVKIMTPDTVGQDWLDVFLRKKS